MQQHRLRVERNGGSVPVALQQLERIARFRVTKGQDGSGFGESPATVDDQVVTPRLLTFRQVGDALACSESTVKRLVTSRKLPAVHVGGATRVRVADLDAYVAALGEPKETVTACHASRRDTCGERPPVNDRKIGMVPTGSMITKSVTKTLVRSTQSTCEA